MEKFVELEVHEYMDMYPHKEVRTFIARSCEEIEHAAKLYAERMTKEYSGGPTRFVKVMSEDDARKYLTDQINAEEGCDCPDVDWIEKVTDLFVQCYNVEL